MKVTEDNIIEVVQKLLNAQCCPVIIPTEERQSITSPTEGMIIFDTLSTLIAIYVNGQWVDSFGNILP